MYSTIYVGASYAFEKSLNQQPLRTIGGWKLPLAARSPMGTNTWQALRNPSHSPLRAQKAAPIRDGESVISFILTRATPIKIPY